MEDNELLEGLKQGDTRTLQYIYKEYFPKVLSWITKHEGSADDAYDVFQEVMESLLLNIHTIYKSFGGTVMFMTKNKWIDKIRKSQTHNRVRNTVGERQSTHDTHEDAMIKNETEYQKFKLMEETFSKLSTVCQKVIALIKQGKDTNEIVTSLQFKSPNTMYRRKAACIERWSLLIKESSHYKNIFS